LANVAFAGQRNLSRIASTMMEEIGRTFRYIG
jgi:hypothetical protein